MFSIVGTLASWVVTVISAVGLPGLFALMTVESFGVPPLPSEVILPFAGFMIVTDPSAFPLVATILVALAGSLLGAYIAYAAGRWARDRVTGMGIGPIRLEARHLVRMDAWFARHGEPTVALARLAPVLRAYISYPAGSARMAPGRFGIYTLAGSIPFTLGFVYAGIALGDRWDTIAHYFTFLDYAFIALVGLAVVYLIYLYVARVHPDDLRREAAERTASEGGGSPPPPPGRSP